MSRLRLILLTLVRVALSTGHRMIYSFLPEFARRMSVDATAISALVANRALFGAATPFLFPFLEPRGRRFGMILGLVLFTVGMALVVIQPGLTTLGVALVLGVLGKVFFDPSVIAYLADHSSYEQRGTITALSEFAWSFASILGVPAMGFLLDNFNWTLPFLALSAAGTLSLFAILFFIRDPHRPAPHAGGRFGGVRAIFASAPVLAGLSIGVCATISNELVNLNFGRWLEDSFHVKIAALAMASAVIGLSELGGEGLVAIFADRLGKVRATGLGLAVNCAAALLLPIVGRTEFGALAGLFLYYISFEFTIVSQIPLMSEVMPAARATTLSFNAAGHSLGRAFGALAAPVLYALGFSSVAGAAIGINLLGLAAVWYVSRHHD